MSEALALIATLIALLVLVCCALVVWSCLDVYVPASWDQRRGDLLARILTDHFGLGRGLDRTDRRDRRVNELLSGWRPPNDTDEADNEPVGDRHLVARAVMRMRRVSTRSESLVEIERHSMVLATRELRRIEDWARSRENVDQLLRFWRLVGWTALVRLWAVGAQRHLVPVAMDLGSRAASVAGLLGMVGVVGALGTYYVRVADEPSDDPLGQVLGLVGSWTAAGAVMGIVAVLGAQGWSLLRDAVRSMDVPRRRVVLAVVVPAAAIMTVAAGHAFGWQVHLLPWQVRTAQLILASLPERWQVVAGAALVVSFLSFVTFNAARSALRREIALPGRVFAFTAGSGSLVLAGAAIVLVVAPDARLTLGLVTALVMIAVAGAAVWVGAHLWAHHQRLRRLAVLGIAVERKMFHGGLLTAAALAPFVIGPMIVALEEVTPPRSMPALLMLGVEIPLAFLYLGSNLVLGVQFVASVRYFRRVRSATERTLQPDTQTNM